MFTLSVFNDTVPVEPHHFNKNYEEHLKALLQDKYVDRVVADVGLVIAFYDFMEIRESRIYAGDGRAHFKVTFRMIVFQPFPGEILQGVISGSNAVGIQVSMDFFHDIRVPSVLLRDGRFYDAQEGTWFWEYEGHRLPYTCHSVARFRVKDVRYNKKPRAIKPAVSVENESENNTEGDHAQPPMVILAAMNEDGLGLRAWWED